MEMGLGPGNNSPRILKFDAGGKLHYENLTLARISCIIILEKKKWITIDEPNSKSITNLI